MLSSLLSTTCYLPLGALGSQGIGASAEPAAGATGAAGIAGIAGCPPAAEPIDVPSWPGLLSPGICPAPMTALLAFCRDCACCRISIWARIFCW